MIRSPRDDHEGIFDAIRDVWITDTKYLAVAYSDIDPFVAAVVGGAQQIPEPSTLLLCVVALVCGRRMVEVGRVIPRTDHTQGGLRVAFPRRPTVPHSHAYCPATQETNV
jgi:hypothetical protein